MKKIILFSITSFILFTNCSDNTKTTDWYLFEETHCSNPWELAGHKDTDVATAVKSYLCDDLDIKVRKVTIDGNLLIETCHACSCKTGKNIRVKVKGDDNDKAVLLSKRFVLE